MNLETAVFCTPVWGSINASYTEMALRDPKVKRLVYCCSVTQLCPTLCDPTDCSKPSFHVLHQLPKLAQTHLHRVGDAIQPSPPLLSPSLPAFDLSQHQGLSQWVGSLHQGPEYWNFSFSISPSMNIQGWFPLGLTGLISLMSKGLSKVFPSTTVWRHPFFSTQPSL